MVQEWLSENSKSTWFSTFDHHKSDSSWERFLLVQSHEEAALSTSSGIRISSYQLLHKLNLVSISITHSKITPKFLCVSRGWVLTNPIGTLSALLHTMTYYGIATNLVEYPTTFGKFITNYIIFRNAEIFPKSFQN